MTLEEKRNKIGEFCDNYESKTDDCCEGCIFDSREAWCYQESHYDLTEIECDEILAQIGEYNAKPNPYWDNITKIAEKQRAKGMETYGQGLEDNDKPTLDRITYIEEELVDALMYLEWLKEKIANGR